MATRGEEPRLLDTNVLSFFLKGDTRADRYRPDVDGKLVAVSFATVGELYKWANTKNKKWSAKKISDLESRLRRIVILPSNDSVARHWGRIASIPGLPIADNDAWIAACAFTYGCILVTHDRVFTRIRGLKVITHLGP